MSFSLGLRVFTYLVALAMGSFTFPNLSSALSSKYISNKRQRFRCNLKQSSGAIDSVRGGQKICETSWRWHCFRDLVFTAANDAVLSREDQSMSNQCNFMRSVRRHRKRPLPDGNFTRLRKWVKGSFLSTCFLHVLSLGMIERCKHSPHDVAFQCKKNWPRIRRYGSLNRTGPRSGRYSSLQIVLEENGSTMEEHKVKMQV